MDLNKIVILVCLTASTLFADPPPPPPDPPQPTNCITCVTTSPPTFIERYGYQILMQWTNTNSGALVGVLWSTNGYPDACSMVPTSHVAIVSNGVPLQADNTNEWCHEASIFSDGNHIVAVFWAPNAFSATLGLNFTGLHSTNWLDIPHIPKTNIWKDATRQDPWFPIIISGHVSSKGFFRVRRNDYGLGWTNVCY